MLPAGENRNQVARDVRMKRAIVTVAAAALVACACSAGEPLSPARTPTEHFTIGPGPSGEVRGAVVDSLTGAPLTGVNIEWTGLAEAWGDRGHGTFTQADGTYRLVVARLGGPGSEIGLFMLRASKDGYGSREVQIRLADRVTVDFSLRKTGF